MREGRTERRREGGREVVVVVCFYDLKFRLSSQLKAA